jgi:pimeloyl-ACP methyl ester carboxylesterase
MSTSDSSPFDASAAPTGCEAGCVLVRDGVRLHYRDEGAGPALVLIHGWLMDLTAWDAEQPAWSRRFRVLRMDRRGFGRSSGTPCFACDADDVLALLDDRGVERASLLGMSQGARVALDLAQRAPGRVSALVLDGAPALDGLPGGPWLQETPLDRYRKLLAAGGLDALRVELAAHPLMQLHSREPAARQAIEAMLARYTGADLADATAAQPSRPVDLTQLRLPVLVVNGERDTAQRLAVGTALADAIPGARRRIIPAAGHLACLDQPAAYARIVSDFLVEHTDPTLA